MGTNRYQDFLKWLVEFIFPLRLHRLAFFLRCVAADIMPIFLYVLDPETHPQYFLGFYIVLLVYSLFFIVLPRIRDVGMNGWWLLLYLIPIVNIPFAIILMFRAPNYRFGATVDIFETKT